MNRHLPRLSIEIPRARRAIPTHRPHSGTPLRALQLHGAARPAQGHTLCSGFHLRLHGRSIHRARLPHRAPCPATALRPKQTPSTPKPLPVARRSNQLLTFPMPRCASGLHRRTRRQPQPDVGTHLGFQPRPRAFVHLQGFPARLRPQSPVLFHHRRAIRTAAYMPPDAPTLQQRQVRRRPSKPTGPRPDGLHACS